MANVKITAKSDPDTKNHKRQPAWHLSFIFKKKLKKQRTKKPKSASGKLPGVKLEVAWAVGVQTL